VTALRTLARPARGRPADDVVGEHRPAAGREVVLVGVVQAQPAVAFVDGPVPGEPGIAGAWPPASRSCLYLE
jgi:hypothetical protein